MRSSEMTSHVNKQFSQLFDIEGLGTRWWFGFDKSSDSESIKTTVSDQLEKFEKNYSRFREESLISQLNRKGRLEEPPKELVDMLNYAAKLRQVTSSNFDITVGRKLEEMGYDADYSFNPKFNTSRSKFGGKISIGTEIIELEEGVRIDLGGFGKGWLIDKLVGLLQQSSSEFFINAGGDVFVYSESEREASFSLENPFETVQSIGSIKFSNASIACSAPNRRQWKDTDTGETFHHLVKVSDFVPQKQIAAVFTYGETAKDTDAASTAIFVSPAKILPAIQKELGVEFMIVFDDGTFFSTKDYLGELFS